MCKHLKTPHFILLSIILSLMLASCIRHYNNIPEKAYDIETAKTWFSKFLTGKKLDPNFEQAIYVWEKAQIFTYDNGYQAIAIPILYPNQNSNYKGRRVLYLYPWKNQLGYYSTVFEFLPDEQHLTQHRGKLDLAAYDGFISSWDILKGFVQGAKFKNGVPVDNISIDVVQTLGDGSTSKGGGVSTSNSLLPVTVVGIIPGPNWGFFLITLRNSLGYTISYPWSGADANPCEYTGCHYSENPADYFDGHLMNEIYNQLKDQQWVDEKLKDSTQNPCAGAVMEKLAGLSNKFPTLIRDFFSVDAGFNMTVKWANLGAGVGASTTPNFTDNNFSVTLNSYFSNATDLSMAATLMHEAVHCQLMDWFRRAQLNNDIALQEQLTATYGYIFTKEFTNGNNSLQAIINGMNPTHHQDMVNRYNNLIATALGEFAHSKGLILDMQYCKDLAWVGTFDSEAFKALSDSHKERILNVVNSEKDPDGSKGININDVTPKGKPCE